MKDNNNLCDYNVWSGTDYNKNTQSYYNTSACNINSNNNFSINGEHSINFSTNESSSWPYLDCGRISGISGKITAELTVYAPKGYIRAVLYANPNENIVITDVYQNDKPQKIVLSGDIPANYQYLTVRLFPRNDNVTYYVDDITFINK